DAEKFEGMLLPSGHILGAAQIWIERKRDGASLLYTGDFKLRKGVSSPQAEMRAADRLIMETTFGRPTYQLPPSEEVLGELVKFVTEALEDGLIPVIGAYSLGKTQELLAALGARSKKFSFVVHRSAKAMTELYEELGACSLPPWEVDGPETVLGGKVLIVPPSVLRSQRIRKLPKKTTAMVTGWGIDPNSRFRYQVDAVFPLSDHADYPDLLRSVEQVSPKEVLTLHGFADDFARDLRGRGYEAWSLTGTNQLELFDAILPSKDSSDERSSQTGTVVEEKFHSSGGNDSFGRFAALCDDLAHATGKKRKTDMLASYFVSLTDDSDLAIAATYLSGRPFPKAHAHRSLQVGWRLIKRALLAAVLRSEADYQRFAVGQNDGGRVARRFLEGRTTAKPCSLREVDQFFSRLGDAKGPGAKEALLKAFFQERTAREGAYLVKILGGDLRIGLREGLVEEAIAIAFRQPPSGVRRAHMLTGELGKTAIFARQEKLHLAKPIPFVPLQSMLASPEETAHAFWERLEGAERGEIWAEEKYDGIRAQIHRQGDRCDIYSRDLRSLSAEFPELLAAALSGIVSDVILDGEIIASAEGRRLTFFDLQKRLGRRHEGDLFFGQAIPVRFIAFDLLWKDGKSMLEDPLRERRKVLESLDLSDPFDVLALHRPQSVEEVEAAFADARRSGNEGLIGKDPESGYSLGKRGHSWVKLKAPMPTLDCVVVAAEEGHGKRSHVLSDYTFAVLDERTDTFVVIGKAYSGLTDQEIEELTERFLAETLRKERRKRFVEPRVVLEIAFDSIQPSKRHSSGLALRFPRIHSIRRDKNPRSVDTLEYARRLAGLNN
ncbi:MAG: ATP-dependent DNA ligase, partial [Verrucomicrobiota bacterium]